MAARKITKWSSAAKVEIHRSCPFNFYNGPLERGVNYFVLALEQLGATTEYSREGHPNGFYIIFNAPQTIAEAVRRCGFFSVELEGEERWSLRINRAITEPERQSILSYAALAWTKTFGPILYSKERKYARTAERVPE